MSTVGSDRDGQKKFEVHLILPHNNLSGRDGGIHHQPVDYTGYCEGTRSHCQIDGGGGGDSCR